MHVTIRMGDGSQRSVPLAFKDVYMDEYTSRPLPHGHICAAMADEIKYLMDHVLVVVPASEAQSDPGHKLVGQMGQLKQAGHE